MDVSKFILVLCILAAFLSQTMPAQTPQSSGLSLGGTSWRLVSFRGGDDTVLAPTDRDKYTLAFGTDGNVSVRIDCNRGRGTWKSSGPNQLEFGPLTLTRAFCPPAPINDRIGKDWPYVRSYTMKDGHLFLSLMADAGTYEFEPVNSEEKAATVVKGTATYRERMTSPPNAVFESTLEDVSRADAQAEQIGQTRIEHPGNPPIAFEISYDSSRINPSHRYTVRARVLVDGKVLFTTDQNYPVLTSGHGNEVSLLLRRVGPSGQTNGNTGAVDNAPPTFASAEPLKKTYWKLVRLIGTPVVAASQQQEPNLVFDSQSRRVTGSGGCNRLTGSYEFNGDKLTFSQMASSMMACPNGMETERRFLTALQRVSQLKIMGGQLELLDGSGNVIAVFEAGHEK
jgi:putative lipoprotein